MVGGPQLIFSETYAGGNRRTGTSRTRRNGQLDAGEEHEAGSWRRWGRKSLTREQKWGHDIPGQQGSKIAD